MTEDRTPYPVRVDAALDPAPSRWLWLVKWLLLVPHAIVLAFLWLAFAVLTVVAFFGILVTGRYPRALFDFNVGVLRWTWRVQYYGYAALGTDRYPPFTLADVPDYPARLDVEYPERLSRGLVLVKWWLLAIPQYLVVAVFAGGGVWLGTRSQSGDGWGAGGLIVLLVVIAGVVVLFSGRYPRSLYDFVLGMDRWVVRVAAYAALMTDRYPPFRMDMGGADPGSLPAGPPPAPADDSGAAAPVVPPAAEGAVPATMPTGPGSAAAAPRSRWTAGRVVAVVVGALLLVASSGLLVAGGGLLWADQTQREDGWLNSPDTVAATTRYALVTDDVSLDTDGADWVLPDTLGRVRVAVTPRDPDVEVFVGVARTSDLAGYLTGVARRRLDGVGPGHGGWGGTADGSSGWSWTGSGAGTMTDLPGGGPATPPTAQTFWETAATGSGPQVLEWTPAEGNWTAVVMRADGTAGVAVTAQVGATVPGLTWLAVGLLVGGVVLLAAGALLIALAVHRAQTPPAAAQPAWPDGPTPPAGPVPAPRSAPADTGTTVGRAPGTPG